MNKTIYIHIGPMKTGTTAIQSFLNVNRYTLKQHGVLYPGKDRNHYPIAYELSSSLGSKLERSSFTSLIFEEIADSDAKRIILSTEGFSEQYSKTIPELKAILDYHKLSCDVKIILFLRAQESWLESAYQESIKEMKVRNKLTFYEFINNRTYFNLCNYYDLIGICCKYFGKENVIFGNYEMANSQFGVIDKFLQICNLQFIPNLIYSSNVPLNIGLQTNSIELLRWLNILKIGSDLFEEITRLLSKQKRERTENYNLLTLEQRCFIREYFEPFNQKVLNQYLNQLDGALFQYPEPKGIGTEYIQNDSFCSNQFSSELMFIYDQNATVFELLYKELSMLNASSRVVSEAKIELLSFLQTVLSKEVLTNLDREYPIALDEYASINETTLDWSTVLNINYDNFLKETDMYSPHVVNSISTENQKVKMYSSGDDPYFSIRKCLGNYNSKTLLQIEYESPADTYLSVYFQTRKTDKFLESLKVVRPIRKGGNEVCVVIDHTEFNGLIRIDPGAKEGYYFISEIKVKSNARSYEELFYELERYYNFVIDEPSELRPKSFS